MAFLVAIFTLVVTASGCSQFKRSSDEEVEDQTTVEEDTDSSEDMSTEENDVMTGDSSDEDVAAEDEDSSNEDSEEKETESPAPPQVTPPAKSEVKSFSMTAKQFEFTPSTITVNEGDTVRLNITSTDVTHGFALPEFGVNKVLPPNSQTTVEFVASKKGTFGFFCSVSCGSGHTHMEGTVVVK